MAKFSAALIKEQTKKIQKTIDKERRHYREQNFTEVTPKDVAKKMNAASRLYRPSGSPKSK
jgi:hypothetical protein